MLPSAKRPGAKPSEKDCDQKKGRCVADCCTDVPVLGIVFAVTAGGFMALTLVFARMSGVHPLMVLFERNILSFQGFLCAAILDGQKNFGIKDKKSLFLVTLCGTFGAFIPVMSFMAIVYIPAADTVTILFSSPVFVTLYTCITTLKIPGFYQLLVVGLTVSGVIIVMKPAFIVGASVVNSDIFWLEGCLLALGSSISYAGFCVTCNLCKHLSSTCVNLVVSAICVLVSVVILAALNSFTFPLCGMETVYTFISIITGICAAGLMILASKREKAGPVTIGAAAQIPVIIILQICLTNEVPSWNSYVGSALIITSVLISGWLRWRQQKILTQGQNKKEHLNSQDLKKSSASLDLSLLEESRV